MSAELTINRYQRDARVHPTITTIGSRTSIGGTSGSNVEWRGVSAVRDSKRRVALATILGDTRLVHQHV